MDIGQRALDYHNNGFNCAQSVFAACCEYTGMDEKTALALSAGFGGGARSPLWCQCISDAAGVRVHVPSSSEAAGRGAAVLAGTAAGAWTKEAFPKDTGGNTYLPSDTLRDCYRRYREIERKLWAKEAVCSTS